MVAQKKVSHFSISTDEFAMLVKDVQDNAQIPDPSNLKRKQLHKRG